MAKETLRSRRGLLDAARREFGPRIHFLRIDEPPHTHAVTVKPLGRQHVILARGDSWASALAAARALTTAEMHKLLETASYAAMAAGAGVIDGQA